MSSKVCSRCGIEKPYSAYHADKRLKLPYRSFCKECAKEDSQKAHKTGVLHLNEYLHKRCEHKCEHCGVKFPREILEFHHPVNVKKEMPDLAHSKWRGVEGPPKRTVREADKCVVLCSNCHKYEHLRLRNEGSSFRLGSGRPGPKEDLGSGYEGLGQQASLYLEESNK